MENGYKVHLANPSAIKQYEGLKHTDGKKKDKNDKKNGNKYLSWAYIEAANFIRRYCPKAEGFYQRKVANAGGIVATKELSNKVARASYYVMRDQVPFDEDKLFA